MFEEIERIKCSDETGAPFTVVIFQEIKEVSPLKTGVRQHYGGTRSAQLTTGERVNFVDAKGDTFQVLATGAIIRRANG